MSRLEIDVYVLSHNYELCASCTEWPQAPCCHVFMEIEKNNLLFVNGYITHAELLQAYRSAADAIAHIPRIPGFKEQLKNAGTFLVGAVAGFAAAGPIGLFTGSASAIGKIISEEKARMAAKIQNTLTPEMQKVQSAANEIQQNKLITYAIFGVGGVAAAGLLYWALSD